MLFTNAYLLYKATHGNPEQYNSQKFFAVLADNLIDSMFEENEGKSTRASKKRKFEVAQLKQLDSFMVKTSLKNLTPIAANRVFAEYVSTQPLTSALVAPTIHRVTNTGCVLVETRRNAGQSTCRRYTQTICKHVYN